MTPTHAARALVAVSGREMFKFWHQRGRLFSALVRPTLWLVVFAVGFQNVFGVSIIPPYETYIEYQEYIVPGLVSMVLLFNGMQSSLAMVYDREMGMMRLLLTAPLPRWYLLFSKLVAGTVLSVLQVYAFLLVTVLFGVHVPPLGWLYALPAIALGGMMLGATGLLLSVYVRQLENFAGTMNFVIFPMFFISSRPVSAMEAARGGGGGGVPGGRAQPVHLRGGVGAVLALRRAEPARVRRGRGDAGGGVRAGGDRLRPAAGAGQEDPAPRLSARGTGRTAPPRRGGRRWWPVEPRGYPSLPASARSRSPCISHARLNTWSLLSVTLTESSAGSSGT